MFEAYKPVSALATSASVAETSKKSRNGAINKAKDKAMVLERV